MNFIMFPEDEGFKSNHITVNEKNCKNRLKDLYYTFIELPKFNKTIDQLKTMEDKWCYFFKHAATTNPQDYNKLIKESPILKRAFNSAPGPHAQIA